MFSFDSIHQKKTYRASGGGAACAVVIAAAVLAVGITAGTAEVVSLNGDGVVELRVSGRRVLEDGEPSSAVAVTNTNVERSVVAPVVGLRSPLAGGLGRHTGGVDVVLGGGGVRSPLVVSRGVRASEVAGLASLNVDWDGLGLGTLVELSVSCFSHYRLTNKTYLGSRCGRRRRWKTSRCGRGW